MIKKLWKAMTADVRKEAIIKKILSRSNLCMYNQRTGKKYVPRLYISHQKKYDPCTGQLMQDEVSVRVHIYSDTRGNYMCTLANVKRSGEVCKSRWGSIHTIGKNVYIK